MMINMYDLVNIQNHFNIFGHINRYHHQQIIMDIKGIMLHINELMDQQMYLINMLNHIFYHLYGHNIHQDIINHM
jgi:hypothetical protein